MTDATEDEFFDPNAALREIKPMWLKLARHLAQLSDGTDWIDDPKNTTVAMEWAAQAEACFWRATGDDPACGVQMWVTALREDAGINPAVLADLPGGRG